MKKIALTSLLAALAVSGAHAANTIDGNPLYMPKANHFYSVTSLESHSENESLWTLGEQFGYGISDKLAVEVSTTASEAHEFDYNSWNDVDLAVAFRALNNGAWKLDLIGAYGVDNVYPDHAPFLKKELTMYGWTAGVRGGYTTARWTVAGHAYFTYGNTESFNWDDEGAHIWNLGLDAQFVIDNNWNLVSGANYRGQTDDYVKNAGIWTGMFGVNYNIDATKFVGAYVNGSMSHRHGANADEWKSDDGFGFGAKFGIDF